MNLPAPVTITFFETCPGRFICNWDRRRASVPVLLEMPMKLRRHANPSTSCRNDRKDRTAIDTIQGADNMLLVRE